MILIDSERCIKNHVCVATISCPAKAMSQTGGRGVPSIDYNKCTQCGLCVEMCTFNAIINSD